MRLVLIVVIQKVGPKRHENLTINEKRCFNVERTSFVLLSIIGLKMVLSRN